MKSLKKKSVFAAVFILLVFAIGVKALTPVFVGQVTRGIFYGAGVPDCSINGYPMGPVRPYLGEVVTANIIENSQTLSVVNALGGNPVSEMERCTSYGALVELGCSAGYFNSASGPDDFVGAIEYTAQDVDPSGSMNLRCEQYKSIDGQTFPGVVLKPAFFHPTYPNYTYNSPTTPGPIVDVNLNCPNVQINAYSPIQSRWIVNMWIEGPAPYQIGQNIIAVNAGCPQGTNCSLSASLSSGGTYHSYVAELDTTTLQNHLSVDSFYC